MAKLKPCYQVVTPRDDLRESRTPDASGLLPSISTRFGGGGAYKDYIEPGRISSEPM